METRKLTMKDYDALSALWQSCDGVGLRAQEDSRQGIAQYLVRNPETCFGAFENGELIGAILSGHDGRRGTIGHTAVRNGCRGKGVGRALVALVEEAMRRQGIRKLNMVVFARNEAGNAFWEKLGYTTREDLVYRNRTIVPEEN